MKKRIYVFTLILFSFIPLYGNSKNTFSVSAGLGVLTGNVKELVYSDHVITNQITDLSMLDWQIAAVPYFFVDLESDLFKYLYLNLNGKIGVPIKSGKMQDYDWMNKVSSGNNELTHYSIHDNFVSSYYSADLSIGFNFILDKNFIITPCVAVGTNYISFDGKNGYRQYGNQSSMEKFQTVYEPWSDEIDKVYFYGKVISYNQTQTFFSIGYLSRLSISLVDLNFSFFISPKMAITSIDTHYLRNQYSGGTYFADIMEGSFYYGEASILVNIKSFYKIGLECEYAFVPKLYGYTLSKPVNSAGAWGAAGEGGTKRHFVQISLVNKFVF